MALSLVTVDVGGIQGYIFGSNRLREQIGASFLVDQATGAWAFTALPRRHNVRDAEAQPPGLDDAARIEDGALAAEVLYAGGGNLVALFRSDDLARQFVGTLSRQVLCAAPGLHLTVARQPFDWHDSLVAALAELQKKLAEAKRQNPPSYPLLGLGVTAACQSTGLPSVGLAPRWGNDGGGYPAAAEVLAKLEAVPAANQRAQQLLGVPERWRLSLDTDDLGRRTGDESHVAVVHADGNGMGKRIQAIADGFRRPDQNRAYIQQMRAFSASLTVAARTAQQEQIAHLIDALEHPDDATGSDAWSRDQLRQLANGQSKTLPFRPLIFGGDDLTFLCDGRLGLSLAVEYLRHFERHTARLPDGQGRASAAAGIAIVKSHFPLAQAYQLAEELCHEAKRYHRELKVGSDGPVSTLDWHFALGGLAGDLAEIRRREYHTPDGELTLRPVALDDRPAAGLRCWPVVERGVRGFRGPKWEERRNKVKALRDALRAGPTAVTAFCQLSNDGRPLPAVAPAERTLDQDGWIGKRCGYFDAVEAFDWHIALGETLTTEVASPPAPLRLDDGEG